MKYHIVIIFEIIVNIIKLFCMVKIIFNYGLFFGSSIIFFILTFYYFIIEYLFNIEYLSFDKTLLGFSNRDQYTINLVLCLNGDFNEENIKSRIINNMIKKIPKLQSKIVYIFFNYYWKKFPINDKMLKETIQIIELNSKLNLEEFLQNEVNKRLDTLNDYPYKINIIKFNQPTIDSNCTGCIHLKCDHVLSDGLGILSLLMCLADDFNTDFYPKVFKNKKPLTFLMELRDTILFPFYLIYAFYVVFFNSSFDKTEYKLFYNYHHDGETRFQMTEWYDLDIMKIIRNKYKVSFNSAAVGLFLKSEKDVLQNINSLNIVLPVGYTLIPKKIEEIQLKNLARGFLLNLPLIDNLDKLPELHKIIISNLGNTSITYLPIFFYKILSQLFILKILNFLANNIIINVDMLISNVPGPEIPIKICNCILTDFYPVVSTGRMKAFIMITSFCKKFRYVISFDKSVGYDINELINALSNNINNVDKNCK